MTDSDKTQKTASQAGSKADLMSLAFLAVVKRELHERLMTRQKTWNTYYQRVVHGLSESDRKLFNHRLRAQVHTYEQLLEENCKLSLPH